MPQRRHRPSYPKLPHDQKAEKVNKNKEKCSKYYDSYGAKHLTGGIMVAWCPDSIAYGFHLIPNAEGRNDVFSAMYTRWEEPPEVIVYDFACALGPYCMTREPNFFCKSLCCIDEFHSSGHTRCSESCFISNYAATNPALAKVNSSAAECGNSGLSKIRKSVRYMGQRRAVIYTKVFLSVWNRMKMRRKLKADQRARDAVEEYNEFIET